MKNLGLFVTFYTNLHTRSRSPAKQLQLRLQHKVAAPPVLPGPSKHSLPLQPKTTAILAPPTATYL
jgi:hypothetical protein